MGYQPAMFSLNLIALVSVLPTTSVFVGNSHSTRRVIVVGENKRNPFIAMANTMSKALLIRVMCVCVMVDVWSPKENVLFFPPQLLNYA